MPLAGGVVGTKRRFRGPRRAAKAVQGKDGDDGKDEEGSISPKTQHLAGPTRAWTPDEQGRPAAMAKTILRFSTT